MIRRLACAVLFLAARTFDASAQIAITLRDAGPGPGPQLLARALALPHTTVGPGTGQYVIRKDTAYSQTLIILGRDAIVEGAVHGDLIVVDGDLFMHPGGRVTGRAVAIGGGVYESMLATTGGGISAFREFAYDIEPTTGGFALTYHALETREAKPAFKLSGLYGLMAPSYDRTNGVSLPVGLDFATQKLRLRLTPKATYRSQLGRVDPWLDVTDSILPNLALVAGAGRSTLSNDAWIRSDLVNSLHVISFGNDARNYFRATRGDVTLIRRSEGSSTALSYSIGLRGEHALSTRPGANATGGPWSFGGRRDVDDMLRINPSIENGTIASIRLGGLADWSLETVLARAGLDVELGRASFDSVAGRLREADRKFAQVTFDGGISFPTFGTQSLTFDGHAVFTTRGNTPRQRWVYLGGSGTLLPLELLELGGDQLVFVDGRYNFPIESIQLPVVGPPTLSLRNAIGGAAANKAPSMHQALGLRVSAGGAYVEFMADPATRKHRFGFGISVP